MAIAQDSERAANVDMFVGVGMLSSISVIASEVLVSHLRGSVPFVPTRTNTPSLRDRAFSCYWTLAERTDLHLWTGIRVDPRASSDLSIIKAYLSKSGALLLHITLDLSHRTNTKLEVVSIYGIIAAHGVPVQIFVFSTENS